MKKKKRSAGGKKRSQVWAYPAECRLKVVRLFLEEGYSATLLAEQFGISTHSVSRWANAYSTRWGAGVGTQALP